MCWATNWDFFFNTFHAFIGSNRALNRPAEAIRMFVLFYFKYGLSEVPGTYWNHDPYSTKYGRASKYVTTYICVNDLNRPYDSFLLLVVSNECTERAINSIFSIHFDIIGQRLRHQLVPPFGSLRSKHHVRTHRFKCFVERMCAVFYWLKLMCTYHCSLCSGFQVLIKSTPWLNSRRAVYYKF